MKKAERKKREKETNKQTTNKKTRNSITTLLEGNKRIDAAVRDRRNMASATEISGG